MNTLTPLLYPVTPVLSSGSITAETLVLEHVKYTKMPPPNTDRSEAAEAEQRILGGETVVTKRRVTNEGDG